MGFSDCFGGPSQQEKALQAQTSELGSTMQSYFIQEFGAQQQDVANLNAQINRIQSGQTGPGFGAAEQNARVSEIQANAAAQGRNVAQAVRNQGAGQVFGPGTSTGLTTGMNRALTEKALSSAASGETSALNQETAENYATGRANAAQAASGYATVAGIQNPTQYGSEASQTLNESFGQAKDIQEQKAQMLASIGGLVEGGVGMLAGGLGNLDTTGSSSAGEQFQNFFAGV